MINSLFVRNLLLIKYGSYPVNKSHYYCCVTKFVALSLYKIYKSTSIMFDFDQYLGFLAFLTILTIGFWLMIFLLTFVIPYWIGGALLERMKEIREEKRAKRQA